jgi:hypothetical protein
MRGNRAATHSNTLEYSSFLTDNVWTVTRSAPNGNDTRQSINEPLNDTLQIDADAIPPKKMSCRGEYKGFESMSISSAAEASVADILSWMTCNLAHKFSLFSELHYG